MYITSILCAIFCFTRNRQALAAAGEHTSPLVSAALDWADSLMLMQVGAEMVHHDTLMDSRLEEAEQPPPVEVGSAKWVAEEFLAQSGLEDKEVDQMLLEPIFNRFLHRKKVGKLVFAMLLLLFFFLFGCVYEEADNQGLPNDMANRLLRQDLWMADRPSEESQRLKRKAADFDGHGTELPRISKKLPGATMGTMVSVAGDFSTEEWTMDVSGLMGVPVLHATLQGSRDERVLQIRSRTDYEPLVTVRSNLWIEDAFGTWIGRIERRGSELALMAPTGSPVLRVEEQDRRGSRSLQFQPPAGDSSPLGSATWCDAPSPGCRQRLDVSASRGVDVVLLLALALTSSAFSSTSPLEDGTMV